MRPPKIRKKKLKTGNLQQGDLDEDVRFSDPEHIIYDLTDDSDGEEASAAQIVPYMSLPGADRAVSLALSEPVTLWYKRAHGCGVSQTTGWCSYTLMLCS
jgi:hypothetical protein